MHTLSLSKRFSQNPHIILLIMLISSFVLISTGFSESYGSYTPESSESIEIGDVFSSDDNSFSFEVVSLSPYAVSLHGCNSKSPTTIPSTIFHNGITFTLVGISERSFSSNFSYGEVIIPDSVTFVESLAFRGHFQKLLLPSSITSFDENSLWCDVDTFIWNCPLPSKNIGSVTVNENFIFNPAPGYNILNNPFYLDYKGSVAIPDFIQSLNKLYWSVDTLILSPQITVIPEKAFCGESIGTLVGSNVTTLNRNALFSLTIDHLELPALDTINVAAFDHCSLQSFDLPISLRTLYPGAFSGSCITSIEIPEYVEELDGALSGISSDTSVVIPPLPYCTYYDPFGNKNTATPSPFYNSSGESISFGKLHGYHFSGTIESMTATSIEPLYVLVDLKPINETKGKIVGNTVWLPYGTKVDITLSSVDMNYVPTWDILPSDIDVTSSNNSFSFIATKDCTIECGFKLSGEITLRLDRMDGSDVEELHGYRSSGFVLPDCYREGFEFLGWAKMPDIPAQYLP